MHYPRLTKKMLRGYVYPVEVKHSEKYLNRWRSKLKDND